MVWKTLATKEIFSHPRITLLEDDVQLPGGQKTKYLRFDKTSDAVTLICFREDGAILVQREYAHPVGTKIWQLPGGAIEKGETIEAAARRELLEESHLRPGRINLIGSYLLDSRRSDSKMYVVAAYDCVPEQTNYQDPAEIIESFWLSESELLKKFSEKNLNVYMLASWALYASTKSK